MTSFEAAFGPGAQKIAESFSGATQRATQVSTAVLTRMNEWAARGWSAIPHKRALGISTAVGVGLAVTLSQPAPSLNVSTQPPIPDLSSGSGGQNIPQNVHPMPRAVGSPSAPNLTSMMNRAHINQGNYNINASAQSMRGVDTQSLSREIQGALGGNPRINLRMTDSRRSLTSQRVSDIVSGD